MSEDKKACKKGIDEKMRNLQFKDVMTPSDYKKFIEQFTDKPPPDPETLY